MARRIDGISLFLLLVLAAFGFFRFATGGFAWAVGLTLPFALGLCACFASVSHWSGLRRRAKTSRARAAAELVARWAITPDDEAASAWIAASFPDAAGARFVLVPRAQAGRPLGANELLALYRAHRDAQRLVLLVTGAVEEAAERYAAQLTAPRVALLDGQTLCSVLARGDRPLPEPSPTPKRGRRMRLPNRKQAVFCGLYGLLMLATYLLLNKPVFLAMALVLLFVAVLGVRKAPAPAKLFP